MKEKRAERKAKMKNGEESELEKLTRLSKAFKEVSDNLGSSIKAAHAYKEFERFLDPSELKELGQYRDQFTEV